MLTDYTIDVFRDIDEADEEDIYLDEFADEIDGWVIDALKNIGCYTAKNVLATPREELIERADLEESTVDDVLAILAAEFEDDEPIEEGPEAEEEYEDNGEIPEDEAENSDGSDENNNEKEEH